MNKIKTFVRKQIGKINLLIAIAVITLLLSCTLTQSSPSAINQESISYTPSGRIEIFNNAMFGPSHYDFPGEGTEEKPFIIEGHEITASDGPLIFIWNTNVHFIIRNNILDGITNGQDGIYHKNVVNGKIEGNKVFNCRYGLVLTGSSTDNIVRNNCFHHNTYGLAVFGARENLISENNVFENTYWGIDIRSGSFNNTFRGNNVRHNSRGFYMNLVNHNYLVGNKIYENNGLGIYLINSDNNTLEENEIISNSAGLSVYNLADNNIIRLNTFYNHTGNALGISRYSYNNTFVWNDFIDNYLTGIGQVSDSSGSDSLPNIFDYNHYSDWITPDEVQPFGIVDIPYSIKGTAINEDPHPLTNPSLKHLRMNLKLSGEFDYLLKEEIHLQIAALLTNVDTREPISGANITFTIYDPEGQILIQDNLIEEVSSTGVYIYKTEHTMAELELPKGIYIVIAEAQFFLQPIVTDMIEFHIDPPGEDINQSGDVFNLITTVAIGLIITSILLTYFKKKFRLKS